MNIETSPYEPRGNAVLCEWTCLQYRQPCDFSRLYNFTAGIGTHFTGHLLWREFSTFPAAKANQYNSAFFVPSGTHYCRVNRGRME